MFAATSSTASKTHPALRAPAQVHRTTMTGPFASGRVIAATLLPVLEAQVSSDKPDLSLRQLAVLLILAEETEMQTVRGLAHRLNVAKPAITRALDRLEQLGMVERVPDLRDRRSVLAQMLPAGWTYVEGMEGS